MATIGVPRGARWGKDAASDPQEEPTTPIMIGQREHQFMVDTGYLLLLCIGKQGSKRPLSKSFIKTFSFSWEKKWYILPSLLQC